MPRLGVNIDHIATLRQARRESEPDPIQAAVIAELAGADGITVHLREDRRHIQDRDVEILRRTIQTKLNLEMAAVEEIVAFACRIKPDDVCLVPEKRQELTTEGGLLVSGREKELGPVIKKLQGSGIRVSLFVNAEEEQIQSAARVGADCIEIHTGSYAEAVKRKSAIEPELEKIRRAVELGRKLGLLVNAGHGLDYRNVRPVAAIKGIEELNIGFAIIARAALVGLDKAVREMKELLCAE